MLKVLKQLSYGEGRERVIESNYNLREIRKELKNCLNFQGNNIFL